MIYFIGTSHAATHLRDAAVKKGIAIAPFIDEASVIFVSEDTKTDEYGNRDVYPIRDLVEAALKYHAPVVITSQVPPGFTRSFGVKNIYHQAETLRILDAEERAEFPEQIIVGGEEPFSAPYWAYLKAFRCPINRMSWEDAEFSKIAINMFLASQVDTTNMLAAAAVKVGANWNEVANVLRHDKRIGQYAYLTPGRWQDSLHLLRDHVTLEAIRHTS